MFTESWKAKTTCWEISSSFKISFLTKTDWYILVGVFLGSLRNLWYVCEIVNVTKCWFVFENQKYAILGDLEEFANVGFRLRILLIVNWFTLSWKNQNVPAVEHFPKISADKSAPGAQPVWHFGCATFFDRH